MEAENALAAGQGGSETQPQTLTGPVDEFHRRAAVEELAGYLLTSKAMLARCNAMSSDGERLAPIHAAARLLNANARVARELAHAALVETRRRTIIERIQPPQPKEALLNSGFTRSYEDARAELKRRIDAALVAEKREAERLEGLNIGCFI